MRRGSLTAEPANARERIGEHRGYGRIVVRLAGGRRIPLRRPTGRRIPRGVHRISQPGALGRMLGGLALELPGEVDGAGLELVALGDRPVSPRGVPVTIGLRDAELPRELSLAGDRLPRVAPDRDPGRNRPGRKDQPAEVRHDDDDQDDGAECEHHGRRVATAATTAPGSHLAPRMRPCRQSSSAKYSGVPNAGQRHGAHMQSAQ